MDNQGNKVKGAANQDLFLQLTDDLLILILSMLNCDLKFLYQCVLISKRFALLIPLVSSATLSIPRPQESSPFEFFQAQAKYVAKALKNFQKIRFLHLEFVEEKYKEFNLQWKAVFGSKTCTSACLLFDNITKLSSASISATTTAESQPIIATLNGPIFWRIFYPNLWRSLLTLLQPMVERVVITDSERQGKACFRNSGLRDARTCTSIPDAWNNRFEEGQTSLRCFEVPELRLPKSGFLMKGVSLFISKIGENSPVDHKYDDMLNCDFLEEEEVFGEALNLILRTPEDRIEDCHLYSQGVYISLIKIF